MSKTEELESALQHLYGVVFKLRIENEVNKTIIHGLTESLLRANGEALTSSVDSIQFTSDVNEAQIKQQWSEQEANHFRELIDHELKLLKSLESKTSE